MVEEYDSQCEICKIFSNSNRLKILMSLRDKCRTVNDIAKETNLPQPVVSQHLSIMKLRKILEIEKKGSHVYYKIKYSEIMDAFDIMIKIRGKIQNEN